MQWSVPKTVGAVAVTIGICFAVYVVLPHLRTQPPLPPADKLELLRLLDDGEFARLDQILQRFQTEYEHGKRPEWHVQHAFEAFANTAPAILPQIDRWRAAYPDSFAPWLALGTHMQHRAWLKRGWRVAQEVHAEQWRGLREDAGPAIAALRAAIARRPKLTEAYAQLIYILNAAASREQALAVVRQGLSAVPDSVRVHQAHLWMLTPHWGGDLEQLVGAIEQIGRDFPFDDDLLALRGQINQLVARSASLSGDPALALRYLQDAREVGAHFEVEEADLLTVLGRPADALLAYGRALDEWPQKVEAHRGLANLLQATPAKAGYRQQVDLLLALDGLNPDFLTLRAQILAEARERDEALRDYEQALIYGAYDPYVLARAGEFLITVPGKREAAVSALNRSLLLAPEDASLTSWVAGALGRIEDCSLLPDFEALLERYLDQCGRGANCPNFEFNREQWRFSNDSLRQRCAQGPVSTPPGAGLTP
jgi:tetratricopeptide (TPR) repeat protein